MTKGRLGYAGGRSGSKPSEVEKLSIASACEKFIEEVLQPQFLPKIRPTTFNYPIAIYGKWFGNKYRFITRFRSGFPESIDTEFVLTSPPHGLHDLGVNRHRPYD